MNANELRIGNLLKNGNGEIISITGITTPGNERINFTKIFTDKECEKYYHIEGLKPIHVTEEKLLKFGFEKTYADNCYKKRFHEHSLHCLCITIGEKNIATILDEYSGVEKITVFVDRIADYVHQIQNLYFALTGEELATTH